MEFNYLLLSGYAIEHVTVMDLMKMYFTRDSGHHGRICLCMHVLYWMMTFQPGSSLLQHIANNNDMNTNKKEREANVCEFFLAT